MSKSTWAFSQFKNRAVHISTTPVPRNLGESKLVLAALRKFGEVVTFRNLKYDTTNTSESRHGTILAIFDTDQAANNAITASPLTVRISDEINRSRHRKPALPQSTSTIITTPNQHQGEPDQQQTQFLTCQISPSRHNHESAQKRNPYHSTYFISKDTYQYQDLWKSTGIPLRELADGLMGRKKNVPGYIKRKVWRENERLGGMSLIGLYREGMERLEKEKDKGKEEE